ncbi:MAG: N-formylglutamate deformylase [Gammaproteobacteria bacterium]|nr:N-formylglutamate deformylase [Gammaproteobacteria bacterium]
MNDWHAVTVQQGHSPVIVSMPHSGTGLTPEVAQGLTAAAAQLPDTDWHIPALYQMAQTLGVTSVCANYSRYVIDLNRPLDDAPLYTSPTTGLFPHILFSEEPVFGPNLAPSQAHREACKTHIWQAYHSALDAQLQRIKQQYGYAILLDAHSIASQVPMLFSGQLPDFNWGTHGGKSCPDSLLQLARICVDQSRFSQVSNGRFKGGYITRHYGQPEQAIYAIQLELGQDTYLQDQGYELSADKLPHVQAVIRDLLQGLIAWRPL